MDWATQCQARLWGEWLHDLDTMEAAQSECFGRARLVVTVEEVVLPDRTYCQRILYIAPVPIRSGDESFGDASITNRDRFFTELTTWLRGYEAGRKR